MRTSRNGCSGPTHTWRLIFKQSCLLMSGRATLDGPDGWSSGWLVDGHHVPTRMRRQQGGGGVMFWAGIMGRELVGPFRVPEGVKMTSAKVYSFWLTTFSMVPKEEPCLPQQNHLHAWQCTISRCKEYLCVIGCYGHNMRNSWCGHHPFLTSTLLRTFGASSSERSMRVGGS